MGITIWENEKSTFDKIATEAREKGKLQDHSIGYMSKSGDLHNNQRANQRANIYIFRNSNNAPLLFMENNHVAEFNYTYDKYNNQISIIYDKINKQYAYYLHSGSKGHILLAVVSSQSSEFPLYSDEKDPYAALLKLQKIGEIREEDKETTVRATIEKTLLSNPLLKDEAPEILAGFDQILSVDRDREIKPLTPLEIENAKLKGKIEDMERTAREQANFVSKSNEDISNLQEQLAKLQAENESLKTKNADQKAQITKLQTMLAKTLEFATKVRESVVGKLFFKKPLQDLNMDGNSLPEGEEGR